ncbi:MAG TPA: Lrp/AsnC family transcriptional regulator [Thermohalobaculum sp.]|nr:Lrp/AsnC family transcriptional regulator [Thermohalobaculum sp.]
MDQIDARILRALQRDASRPVAELAVEVGLSASACHRRVKLLEESGAIAGYVAQLNPSVLGLPVQTFVEISLSSQSQEALNAFETAVSRFEEILECHLTTGQADYILRVAAQNVADYDNIHRNCLARLPGVARMQTIFVLRSIREWQGYPIRV